MHVFFIVAEFILLQIMKGYMALANERINYLVVPHEVLSLGLVNRILKFGHLFPSVAFSIAFGVKILPDLWPQYALELNKNEMIVPIAIAVSFIPIAILNGMVIEKILMLTNPKYRAFKEWFAASDDANSRF